MKQSSKQKIIDKWLDKNGKKEIEKQVEKEYKEMEKKEKELNLNQKEFKENKSQLIEKCKKCEYHNTLTTQIEVLRERLMKNAPSVLAGVSIEQVINQFLKELSDGKR
jgi:hypothetical protein